MSRYRFRVSRYPENLANLERIHAIMARHNPACKLIVTVSPVHLWATFRPDADVISASCNSKSTLRAGADEFVARHDNLRYFRRFEMATMSQPLFYEARKKFPRDNCVKFIMRRGTRRPNPSAVRHGGVRARGCVRCCVLRFSPNARHPPPEPMDRGLILGDQPLLRCFLSVTFPSPPPGLPRSRGRRRFQRAEGKREGA